VGKITPTASTVDFSTFYLHHASPNYTLDFTCAGGAYTSTATEAKGHLISQD
jgi:hypothetical protein